MGTKILLDADPGIDDALAIALVAGDPDARLVGITTAAGNAPVSSTTDNALALREFLGLDVPVVAGAPRPLVRRLVTGADVHGSTGLGDVTLPAPTRAAEPGSAAAFIARTLRESPGEVTLLATGPLTNVALAFAADPGIAGLARDVVVMGGAATVPGNITPAAEFNMAVDPEAAQIVFDAGATVTMVGLDVTLRTTPSAADLARMGEFGRLSRQLVLPCLNYLRAGGAVADAAIHDACAAAYVLRPDLLDLRDARVDVETAGRFTAGMTVTDLRAEPRRCNAKVALDVDADALWDLLYANYRRLATMLPPGATDRPRT